MHTYKVNTGLELSLERKLADMTKERNDGAKRIVELRQEVRELQAQVKALCNQDEAQAEVARLKEKYDEAKTNMALMTDEIATLKEKVSDLEYVEDALSHANSIKNEMRKREKELKIQLVEWRDRSMGYTKEIEELKSELDELSKAYNDEHHETQVYKKAWREQREIVALRDDQIAMLERRLAKHAGEKTYPFKEGDIYYVLNQLDGTWIESVWDDESERLHDSTDFPDHPHKVYFTVDQKHVLDKFNPEA